MAILDFYSTENSNKVGNAAEPYSSSSQAAFYLRYLTATSIEIPAQTHIQTAFEVDCETNAISYLDDKDFFHIKDDAENVLLAIYFKLNGSLEIHDYMQTDGLPVVAETGSTLTGEKVRFDVELLSDSVNGAIRVHLGGALIFERTGDVRYLSAVPNIKSCWLYAATGNSFGIVISDWFVTDGADEDAKNIEMLHRKVNSNGKNAGFIGSYTDVDNYNRDDNTNLTGSAGQQSTFLTPDLEATYDAYEILAVGVYGRVRSDTLGITQLKPMICSTVTSNEIIGTNSSNNNFDYEGVREIFATAPDGSAWDKTKLDDTEVGIRAD